MSGLSTLRNANIFLHIWEKVELLYWQPSWRASRAQENTPDFIIWTLYCSIVSNYMMRVGNQ